MDDWQKPRLRAAWIAVAAFACSITTFVGTLAVMAAKAATPATAGFGAHIFG